MNAAEHGPTAWTSSELATIDGGADEIEVATRRADGTVRTARIVWVVRHGDSLYVRSVTAPTPPGIAACYLATQVW